VKLKKLKSVLTAYESVLVAYSGGVDSAFVLKVARETLGRDRVKAVTAVSPSLADAELEQATALARTIDVEHIIIQTRELENPAYRANQGDRCFYCKETLYAELLPLAKQFALKTICNGTNQDDLGDYRPGLKAARLFEIKSPLVEARLNKQEVRHYSKALGLPTWNKPAMPCLASRIPHGEEVTLKKLNMVEAAEVALKEFDFKECRVRHHNDLARVEVCAEELDRLMRPEVRAAVSARLRAIGFQFVSIDMEGFESGRLNRALTGEQAL